MTERLVFGRPESSSQAMLRLPTRKHPDYDTEYGGGPIEHLSHFEEHLTYLATEILNGMRPSLLERCIPLELEDMKVMEAVSFRRELGSALTVGWEYIRASSHWGLFFPTGDNDYRWWQISEMTPKLELPSFSLFCIESNEQWVKERVEHRFNDFSEFELILLSSQELTSLKEELTRLD